MMEKITQPKTPLGTAGQAPSAGMVNNRSIAGCDANIEMRGAGGACGGSSSGVAKWWPPFSLTWTFTYVGVGKKGKY